MNAIKNEVQKCLQAAQQKDCELEAKLTMLYKEVGAKYAEMENMKKIHGILNSIIGKKWGKLCASFGPFWIKFFINCKLCKPK